MTWTRYCLNPVCHRPITHCDGSVVAGDMMEYEDGERLPQHVRELCGRCALWFCIKPISDFVELLRANPRPWSPAG